MKECRNCGSYNAYYTKGYWRFEKEKHGFCRRHEKTVESNESCEHWRSDALCRKLRKGVCLKALNNLIKDMSQIAQILQENNENTNDG